ncbi:MAG: metal-dependent hydrolase [archaeon GB-1867-005]|nr:metal-dependent hydrolase [Candidatus Culexmicrobium cathedralense]
MRFEGHAGLSLLIVSVVLFIFDFRNYESIIAGLLVVGFSSLPDLDLSWEIPHRRYTHNILFGFISGLIFGFLFMYSGLNFVLGFVGGFGGTICHLIGDSFTFMKFKPLWPFSNLEVGLGFFKSSDVKINEVFLTIGALSFVFLYVIKLGILKFP